MNRTQIEIKNYNNSQMKATSNFKKKKNVKFM